MIQRRNLGAGILGLALSVGAWTISDSFPSQMANAGAGPDFYPKIIAACLGVTSLALILTGNKNQEGACAPLSGLALAKFLVLALSLAAYIFCIPRLGYFVSTILFSILASFIAYWKFDLKKLLYSCVNTAAICIVIYLTFKVMFKFSIPSGILF
jgi:hypothetical protein